VKISSKIGCNRILLHRFSALVVKIQGMTKYVDRFDFLAPPTKRRIFKSISLEKMFVPP
jgi:hypothetical protein